MIHLYPGVASGGLKREGQLWERFVWTSGGKLELSKCLHYMLFYTFDPDGTPRMESVSNMGDDLVALTTSGQEPIRSAKSNTAIAPKPTGLQACGQLPMGPPEPNLKKDSPTANDSQLASAKLQ
jgi:hypothetical protein